MTYIVYLTTNVVNHKIYIGVHQTKDPNKFDGYIGNGININSPKTYQKGKELLHAAVRKYGVSSFYRTTLKEFDNVDDALALEALLVDERFVKSPNTYNMVLGGGKPPILSKKVYQFDKTGNLIKVWNSQVEINQFYHLSKDVIRECIKSKRDCKNSYWSFEDSINIQEFRISKISRDVYYYNDSGELLQIFDSPKEAGKKLDIDPKSITSALSDHSKLYGGFFLYEDVNIQDILNNRNHIKLSYKPIYRYKSTGEFDCEFISATEACSVCKLRAGGLRSAIQNNRIYHNYKWSYIKADMHPAYQKLLPVKVAQYDLNKNLIKIFDSVEDCKKQFPYAQKVCRKQRKQYKGFIFEYIS